MLAALPIPLGPAALPALLLGLVVARWRVGWALLALPLLWLTAVLWPAASWWMVLNLPFSDLLLAAGLILGYRWWHARTPSTERPDLPLLALAALLGGAAGARLWYLIEFRALFTTWGQVLDPGYGGAVLYGGLGGGLTALALAAHWRQVPLRPLLDRLAGPCCLALALGRIGCFVNGCCYGTVQEGLVSHAYDTRQLLSHHQGQLVWRAQDPFIAFHEQTVRPQCFGETPRDWRLARLPLPLFEALLAAVLAGLAWLRPLPTSLLLMTYGLWRLGIEFWRADQALHAGLSAAQWTSMGLILSAGGLWWRNRT